MGQVSNTIRPSAMRTRLAAALGGVILACAAGSAFAQPANPPAPPEGHGAPMAGRPGPHPGENFRFGRQLLQALNLTDAQKAQLRAIAEKTRDETMPLHQQTRELHEQFQAELAKPQLDEKRISDLQTRELAMGDQIARRMSDARVQSAAVLTAEQRATLEKQFTDLRARFAKHMDNEAKNRGPQKERDAKDDRKQPRGGDLRDLGLLMPMMPPIR